eukprot:CCRYP_000901-RA/>CCRYP_000901-RA protein AED:0.35 eAED:0.34 QI:0/0/0/1/1/1/2/0/655
MHVTAKQLLLHLDDNCGGLHPSKLVNLPTDMLGFYATADSIPKYINMLETAQRKLLRANLPISDNQLLAIASTAVLTSNLFPCPTDNWEAKPHVTKTWTAWKAHYCATHIACKRQLLASGTAMPASTSNAFLTEDDTYLTEGTFARLDSYLDNLAVAATTERTTLQSLTEANAVLVANVTVLTTSVASLTAAYTTMAAIHHTGSAPPIPPTQQPRHTRTNNRPMTTIPTMPRGYCWMHGIRVQEGHSSATCANKVEGHKDAATRANTMGGSMVNKGWDNKRQEGQIDAAALSIVTNTFPNYNIFTTASSCSPPHCSYLAIANTGASGPYFLPQAPLTNINADTPCTTIRTATGQLLFSTGTATLNLPTIPPDTRHGHIVPGLTHNLISIGTLCDAGCTAHFTADTLTITDPSDTVILNAIQINHPHDYPPTNSTRTTTTSHLFTDDTGRFHPRACSGNQYIMIAFHADTNAILVRPFPSKHDAHRIAAYRDIHSWLSNANRKPMVNILDNEASLAFRQAITSNGSTYQIVPPHVHRRNAAEHDIRTFKDHFLAVLAGTAPSFLADRWDLLIPHAELTLNLLRASHCNPTRSACKDLFGYFNFDATPMGPAGCRVLIHNKATTRCSWDYCSHEGFYVGPAFTTIAATTSSTKNLER